MVKAVLFSPLPELVQQGWPRYLHHSFWMNGHDQAWGKLRRLCQVFIFTSRGEKCVRSFLSESGQANVRDVTGRSISPASITKKNE